MEAKSHLDVGDVSFFEEIDFKKKFNDKTLKYIRSGGFGTVFLAQEKSTGKNVAIKVYKKN